MTQDGSKGFDARGPNSAAATHAQFAAGVLAGLGAMALFGSWPVITRAGALALDLPILVFLRFAVPALLLLPVMARLGLVPRAVPVPLLILTVVGSGFPFFLCAAAALALAPVAEAGPLIPGTPPLLVALFMMIWERHKFRPIQLSGLVLIAAGIAAIVGFRIFQSHSFVIGHALALVAAALWSVYTIAFRLSGLTATECAAVVGTWSAFCAVPFGALFVWEAWNAGLYAELAAQFAMQGLGTGVLAILLFGVSVRSLGASEASAMVALGPVFSVLLAIPLLDERPEWPAVAGLVLITIGVVFTNWRPPRDDAEPARHAGVGDDASLPPLDPARWRSGHFSENPAGGIHAIENRR